MARLQGLQAQHECCHQAADSQFQTAVGLLVSSLEGGQDPDLHWLLQEQLCDARLDQAESRLCMVSGYTRLGCALWSPEARAALDIFSSACLHANACCIYWQQGHIM